MKALVGAFDQEKALVGAFSVIVKGKVTTAPRHSGGQMVLHFYENLTRDGNLPPAPPGIEL